LIAPIIPSPFFFLSYLSLLVELRYEETLFERRIRALHFSKTLRNERKTRDVRQMGDTFGIELREIFNMAGGRNKEFMARFSLRASIRVTGKKYAAWF
jgi:hypothetical protein